MILDERSEFADDLAIPTATGRAVFGDVIDLGAIGRDIGVGVPVYFVVQITTTVTSGGAATVAFELVSDAQAALATDGTATLHFSSGPLALAALTARAPVVAVGIPQGGPSYERYLGVLANVGTAALTAGKANAFLTRDYARVKSYADAIV